MLTFEIVGGPMRAGKTTYAKSKRGYIYFSHDDILNSEFHEDFQKFYEKIVSAMNSQKKDAVIDGWFSVYNKDPIGSVRRLTKSIPHKVIITILFTPFDTIYSRMCASGSTRKRTDIGKDYNVISKRYKVLTDIEYVFIDSTDYTQMTFEEFMRKIRTEMLTATEKDVDEFIAFLASQKHDRYYQTVRLPFGKTINGYERTELTLSLIKKTVNFRGQAVLDVGVHHGYVAFGAEDLGASTVTAVDKSVPAIAVAERLKKMWNYETEFVCEDVEKWLAKPSEKKFDIVLCLNMIHHIHNPDYVIKRLFEIGRTVVFEAHKNFKERFDAAAAKTHRLAMVQQSPRWNDLRRMLYCYETQLM